jgi:hypothetical protein
MKKPATKPTVEASTPTTADLVRGMAAHFNQTGTYRAVDICRVLGNPVEGVILEPVQTAEMAYRRAAAS